MIELLTDRMYCKTKMQVINHKLRPYGGEIVEISIDTLLNLKPATGLESAFWFYDKTDNITEICYIAITEKRGNFKITYETNPNFRRQGYMTEALKMLVTWIFSNTLHSEIWALPTNDISKHLLNRNSFVASSICHDSKLEWYVLKKEMK